MSECEDRQITIVDKAGRIIFDICGDHIITSDEIPVLEKDGNILIRMPCVMDVDGASLMINLAEWEPI